MHKDNVNLAGLDLNLITALQALLTHQSVSKAARTVGRTQSAMSHSLARLRTHFHDALLVRDGWAMHLTPYAERLKPRVEDAARAAQAVFGAAHRFDPATDNRTLRLAVPDLCTSLFTRLIAVLSQSAPAMSLGFVAAPSPRRAVLGGAADIGLGFGTLAADTNLVIDPLPPLSWSTFAPRDHAYARTGRTRDWTDATHIVVAADQVAQSPVDKAAAAHGLTRRIALTVPSFSAAMTLAAEADALFTTLNAPVNRMAAQVGLVACPTPMPMPDAPLALMFRRGYSDPFQSWLRDTCLSSLSDLR